MSIRVTGEYANGVWTGTGSPVGEHGLGGAYMGSNAPAAFKACAESQVKVPSEMIAFGDAILRAVRGVYSEGAVPPPATDPERETYYGLMDLNYLIGRSVEELRGGANDAARKLAEERHDGRNVITFSDGHAEAVKRVELYSGSEAMRKRWCNDNQAHDIRRR